MKLISQGVLCTILLTTLVSSRAYAFLANPATAEADAYVLYSIERTASLLNSIFTNTQSYYVQENTCPANNTFALNISTSPSVIEATNYGCVASITFATKGVSPLVAGTTIAVGPSWMSSNNQWNFSMPNIATNINNQQNLQNSLKTCDKVNLLAKSNSFISAYYSPNPVSTLQDPNNTCSTMGIA